MDRPHPPHATDGREAVRFLREVERGLQRFDRSILLAEWNLYTGRSPRGSDAIQLRRTAYLSDPALLGWLRRAEDGRWGALDRRRLELLERLLRFTLAEQDPSVVRLRGPLTRRIVAFRPRVRGRRANRAARGEVLRTDPDDRARREAFYALEPLYRPLEERLRELVAVRNDRARELGFRNFAEMKLGFEGVTPADLDRWVDEVASSGPSRIRRFRAAAVERTGGSWHPWDFSFVRQQIAPLPDASFARRGMVDRVLRAIDRWGFATRSLGFRVVFHDLPAGGLTLAPNPPKDVRVLVHPLGGWSSHLVLFHEFGHAVHSASIRAPPHLLAWHENIPGFGAFHEGIAGLFEEIASDRAWLTTVPGVTADVAERFATVRADFSLLGAVHTAAWLQVEQALYRTPQRDPAATAHRFERRVFGFDEYPALSFVDSFWVDAPVYAPNYLLADLFHYQVLAALRRTFPGPVWPNRRVGPWLRRSWFAPGSQFDWVPRVRTVTGRPFGATDFRERFREAES